MPYRSRGDKTRRMLRAGLLWGIGGAIAALCTVPVVALIHHATGLPPPPTGALLALAAGAAIATAGGGAAGMVIGDLLPRRGFVACGAGLAAGGLIGGFAVSVLVPIYAQFVLDEATRSGTGAVYGYANDQKSRVLRDRRLPDADAAWAQGKREAVRVAQNGAARAPALLLAAWAFAGPVIAGAAQAGATARRR